MKKIIFLFILLPALSYSQVLMQGGIKVDTAEVIATKNTTKQLISDSLATVNTEITWPLLAPNGSSMAPSYSFSLYPSSGIFVSTFAGEPRLNIRGGAGTGTGRGVSFFSNAGSSETGSAGVLIFGAGSSTGNNGGRTSFSAGSTTSTNPAHKGGDIEFRPGSSSSGSSGNILFILGTGVIPGFVNFSRPYTPTSSADSNGSTGSFSWDDNYIYIKTSTGWKRSALTTF